MATTKSDKTREIHDILRLSPRQLSDILDKLDEDATEKVTRERRLSPRVSYRTVGRLAVVLEAEQLGNRTYAVVPRNISRDGMSLLHGKFVYTGTMCALGLRALDGQVLPVHGRVVWCRLISGRIHELGIKFEEPIELSEFVES